MQELRIETVDTIRSPLFRASYALYRRVFPRDEQMPKRYFHEHLTEARLGLSRPFNFHYLVACRGDEVLGFSCGTYLALENMGFVDYLAVDEGATGRGIGTKLRAELVRCLRRDALDAGHEGLTAVLGEVQPGSRWLRRLVGSGRAVALDIDYRQPPLEAGKRAVSLVLYLEPVDAPFEGLEAGQASRLLYALYRRLYRIPYPLQDPSFRYMLKQLRGRNRVGAKTLRR